MFEEKCDQALKNKWMNVTKNVFFSFGKQCIGDGEKSTKKSSVDRNRKRSTVIKEIPKCREHEKEAGCKFELQWSLRCPSCSRRHACRCAYGSEVLKRLPRLTKCERDYKALLQKTDELNDLLNEKNKLLKNEVKLRAEYEAKSQQANDAYENEATIRNKQKQLECEKQKMAGNLEILLNQMDAKVINIDEMLTKLESYRDISQMKLTDADKYRLIRNECDPSVLCIRPPINKRFNDCSGMAYKDCIRTEPNEELFIHGHKYINENDTVTLGDILEQMLDKDVSRNPC